MSLSKVFIVGILLLGLFAVSAQALQPGRPPAAGMEESYTALSPAGGGGAAVVSKAPQNGRDLPSVVWVDDNYGSGGPNDGHTWGVDAFATIQYGVNGVADPGTVHVGPGNYVENITVAKAVTIDGAGAGSTFVYPATSDVGIPDPDAGPALRGSQVFVVQAHNVVISNLTVDGDNPALTSGVVRHGADIDARNGIIEADGPWNGLSVHHCRVKNIYLRGIYARSGGSSFDFSNNTVQNVDGGASSIAIFAYGGSGTMSWNAVSYASDAISANYSRGITFAHNTVTDSGSGVHTDNNGGWGGTADVIQYNTVSNSAAYGYGVWAFLPYFNPTIDQNIVTNVDIGLFAWGGAGGTAQFTANTVNGQGRSGSIATYVTCGPDYWGSWQANVTAYFSGNILSNTSYGVYIESDETAPFFSTTVTAGAPATVFSGVTTQLALFGLGPISVTGLTGSTVEVASPGQIQTGINLATSGGRVTVGPGTYNERITVNRPLDLRGAQYGVDPTPIGARTNLALESTIDITGIGVANPNVAVDIPAGVTDVAVSGFRILGSGVSHYADEAVVRCWDDRITLQDNILDGFFSVLYKGNDYFTCSRNRIITNKVGITVQPNVATHVTCVGNRITRGAAPASDAAGMYMTGCTYLTVTGNVASGFTQSNGIGGSNLSQVEISGNDLSNSTKGVNIWGATTFVTIAENVITGCVTNGIAIKGADITISNNDVRNCAGVGIKLDKNTIDTQRVVVRENDLSGSAGYALEVTPAVTGVVNASANWWGTATGAGVRAKLSGAADYTPWLTSGTDTGDPGFRGDFSTLWVDDDSPQTGTVGRIQEGVDLVSGSAVLVAPGTYGESVTIDKSLTLSGDRGDPNVAGPGPGAPILDGTGLSGLPGFLIAEGVSGVVIEGFEVRNYGPDDAPGANGVSAWNSGTSNVTIRDNYFHHLGWDVVLVGNAGSGLHSNWNVRYNVADHWWAFGMELTNSVNSAIAYNQLSSPTNLDWSSAVLIQAGANGTNTVSMGGITVDHNTITASPARSIHAQANAVDLGTSATLDGVTISNNSVSGSYSGILASLDGFGTSVSRNLTITGNTLSVTDPVASGYVVDISNVGGANTFSNNRVTLSGAVGGGGTYFHGVNLGGAATGSWTMVGNTLLGNGVGAASVGMRLRGTLPGSAVLNVSSSVLSGWDKGVFYSTPTSGADLNFHYDSFAGNTTYGLENGNGAEIDAERCWWGAVDGPSGPGGSGSGDHVSLNVDYDPWIGKTGNENIVCVPDPLVLTSTTPDGNVVVRYLGGGGGMLYGYSMQFSWDVSKVTMASVTQGTLLSSAGLTQFHVSGTTPGTKVVDCVLLGAQDGVTGPGDMFTIHFDSVSGAHGESPVDLTLLAARDKDNNPIGGFYPDDGVINVDTGNPVVTNVFIDNLTLTNDSFVKNGDQLKLTATVTDNHAWPTILADLTALGRGTGPIPPDTYDGTLATWNAWAANCTPTDGPITITVNATDWLGNVGSGADNITADNTKPTALAGLAAAPGHMKVHLSWSNASGNDANYAGVLIRYARWNDYPLYDAAAPEYPNAPGAGIGTAFDGTGAVATHSFGTPNRDIYYYGGFVYDLAGNYSLAATSGQARATNYWLGDVVPDGTWDGQVVTADISTLATTYYQFPPTNAQCDVGPTHNHSRLGIPTPDNATDFEDLMIFAMNYEVVGPLSAPIFGPPVTGATGAVTLALSLLQAPQMGSEFTVVVKLQDAIGVAQATHFQVAYDPAVLTYVGAEAGALLAQHDAVFFMPMIVDGSPDLSIAVLGNGSTFGRSGEIARLRFRQTGAGDVSLRLQDVSARNTGNVELLAQASDVIVGGDVKPLPTEVFVRANTPNPLSHGTSIAYGLPRAQSMRLAVYDVSGRLVRVLVDGVTPAGEQTIQWDRRDSGGRVVSSGMYLYRLETRERTLTHKMIVMD